MGATVRVGLRARLLAVIAVVALLGWVLAVSLVGAGVRRELMLPLLVVAVCVGAGVQVPRLRRVRRGIATANEGEGG